MANLVNHERFQMDESSKQNKGKDTREHSIKLWFIIIRGPIELIYVRRIGMLFRFVAFASRAELVNRFSVQIAQKMKSQVCFWKNARWKTMFCLRSAVFILLYGC